MNLIILKKDNILPLISASAVLNDYVKFRRISFHKIYETLLQNYLFAGYPSALVSLKILKEFYPSKKISKAADMNLYHFRQRGEINCRKVYGNKYAKLIKNIKNFSPDLAEWLVLEGYGKVLGRNGLSFKERELCVVAVLTVLKFEDQLYSHIGGAVKSGSSTSEIQELIKTLGVFRKKRFVSFGLKVLRKYETKMVSFNTDTTKQNI